jgi:hypothetical protein
MNEKLYRLNVYLFAFHLRDRLTSTSSQQNENEKPEWLWRRGEVIFTELGIKPKFIIDKSYCPPDSKNSQSLQHSSVYDKEKEDPTIYPDLLKDKFISIPTQQSRNGTIKINGFAYPQFFHDSYVLMLKIGHSCVDEKDAVEISTLKEFNSHNCLLPDEINSYLGQTLIITIRLTESQKQEKDKADFLKNLADECLNNFIQDEEKHPKYRCQEQLFGSPIFEYGQLIFNSGQVSHVPRYRHILVWFLCDDTAEDNFDDKLRKDFIYLFLYRNKVISTFQKSREVYKFLYTKYQEIEQEVTKINEDILTKISPDGVMSENDLKYLKIKLKILSKIALEYSQLLRNLEHHRNNITDNTHNYSEVIRAIAIKLNLGNEESVSKELSFLRSFNQENCIYFQEKIKSDLTYFGHGSGLLDKAIASIRGIVEIEQAERDRNLQKTIQAVGFGIGAAGVVATSAPYWIKQEPEIIPINKPFISSSLNTFIFIILLSLFSGLLTWGIASGVMNGKSSKENPDKARMG